MKIIWLEPQRDQFLEINKYKNTSKFGGLFFLQLFLINLHLSFENKRSFCQGLLKHSNKSVQMLFSVLRHYANSQSSLTDFNDRVLNAVDMYT